MKRILLAFALCSFVMTAIPRADGADVSVDLFYNNLSGGDWIEVGDYGYGWQPDIVVRNADWRPYTDGYWAYTDYGWTWVSYEDFGWATYHYGRWARLADYGWVWFPGSDLVWGPAWVSWRFGHDYCGWAPLPPRGPEVVYEGRPISGHVDIEFDIGPAYYNFVDLRYIGAPVLRSHIHPVAQNITYVSETVNVTNITVKNKIVYNYGPDYDVLSRHSERPIQRLKIQRESNVNVAAAARSGELTKVQGDKLVVAAPERIQKPAKQIAPPKVKTKVAKEKVKVERGWSVAGDENAQEQLKQKIKSQNLKEVPPPTEKKGAEATAGGSPPAIESPAALPATASGAGAAPEEKGKHGKRGERGQAAAAGPQDQTSPAAAEHGKHKGKPGEEVTGKGIGTGKAAQGSAKEKGMEKSNMLDSVANPDSQERQKASHEESSERNQFSAASEQENRKPGGSETFKNKGDQSENTQSMAGRGPENHPVHQGKEKPQNMEHPPKAVGQPDAEHGHGKPEGGNKKKGEKESPSPE